MGAFSVSTPDPELRPGTRGGIGKAKAVIETWRTPALRHNTARGRRPRSGSERIATAATRAMAGRIGRVYRKFLFWISEKTTSGPSAASQRNARARSLRRATSPQTNRGPTKIPTCDGNVRG